MGIVQTLEKSLTKFGGNNSPTFVAMSIAVAKGIFRPLFTMSDKKESLETKRYTAMREGLTELIAIPIYFLSGVAAQKVAKKLAQEKNFAPKRIYEKYIAGDKSPEIMDAIAHAKKMADINLPKMKSNAAFAGVCISALFLIPMVCSLTIKPIMDKMEKTVFNKDNKTSKTVNQNSLKKPAFKRNLYPVYKSTPSMNMKVGGV